MKKPFLLLALAPIVVAGCKPGADASSAPVAIKRGLDSGGGRFAPSPLYSTADQLVGSKLGGAKR